MPHIYLWDRDTKELLVKCTQGRVPVPGEYQNKFPGRSLVISQRPDHLGPYVQDDEGPGGLTADIDAGGKVSNVRLAPSPAPDYSVELHASANGTDWDSDADIDLGLPAHFRIRVHSGAKSVSVLDGKTKRIPVFLSGASSVIYKKVTFAVTGDVAEAVLTWAPDKNTDYLIRPVDILRSYPNINPEFLAGDARCEVAD